MTDKFWKNKFLLKWLCVALLLGIAYQPALSGRKQWDDAKYIFDNDLVKDSAGLYAIWTQKQQDVNYWPLTHTAFWLMFRVFEHNQSGYHAMNILLHFVNGLLVYVFFRAIVPKLALAVSTVFLLHPLQVESVAWMNEMKNILSGFWFLLTLIFFQKYLFSKEKNHYYWSIVTFILALAAKTAVNILPLILLLLIFYHPLVERKYFLKRSLSHFVISILATGHFLYIEHLGQVKHDFTVDVTPIGRFLVAGKSLLFFTWKTIWPAELMVIYPRWQVHDLGLLDVLPLVLVILLFLFFVYRWWRGDKIWLFSSLFFVISCSPTLGFFDHQMLNVTFVQDHHVYFGLAGLVLMFLSAFTRGGAKLNEIYHLKRPQNFVPKSWLTAINPRVVPSSGTLLLTLLLLVLTLRTRPYAAIYEDEIKLWKDGADKNPQHWFVQNNLAMAYQTNQRLDEALVFFNRSLELNPDKVIPLFNRGNLYKDMGQFDKALADFDKALSIKEENWPILNNRGATYLILGQQEKAINDLTRAIELNPLNYAAYVNRGMLNHSMLKFPEALSDYQNAIKINSSYPPAIYLSGVMLNVQGQYQQALEQINKAITLKPEMREAYVVRGALYADRFQDLERACQDWKKACSLGFCDSLTKAQKQGDCI